MNRLSFIILPLAVAAFACNTPSEDASTRGDDADIVGIGDLGTLESSLNLVWDRDRTRPEDVVKNGPCYKKMVASGRDWNMRRYTTGAAFFFTEPSGEPLSPVSCVDVEEMDGTKDGSGGRQKAHALTGLTLDTAIRFKLGRLHWMGGPQEGPDDGSKTMVFDKGAIRIDAIPTSMPYDIKDNLPEYDGDFRGYIASIQLAGAPTYADLHLVMPGAGMIAYRYAKAMKSTSLATDPLGSFTSVETIGNDSGPKFRVNFEHGAIWVMPGATATVSLDVSGGASTDASCSRPAPGREWQCINLSGSEKWEITPQL